MGSPRGMLPAVETNDVVEFSRDLNVLKRLNGVEHYSFEKITSATNQFTRILGYGSFGIVYFGEIQENDTIKRVAIKLRMLGPEGNIEWKREVNYLGQLKHPNIVKVIGFCSVNNQDNTHIYKRRAVVYEYMHNGSFDKYIYSSAKNPLPLSWSQKMKIVLGVAEGLAFIHNAPKPIILRDFKTSDILLDEGFNAKVSDFGRAIQGPTIRATNPDGTEGYLDPQYLKTGLASTKSDVYGFGVVLLEMLAGRVVIDYTKSLKHRNLVAWGRSKLTNKKKLWKFLDGKMSKDKDFPPQTIEKVAEITHKCLSSNPKKRPNMSQVVEQLQLIVHTNTEV